MLASPATSVAQAPADDGWQFTVTPYLLLPNMSGTIGLGPVTAEVDASPEDIFSNLQFGAMLGAEARKGPWAIGFDGLYMDLGQDATVQTASGTELVSGSVDGYQGAVELTGFRRLTRFLDVLVGGRLNFVGSSIRIDGIDQVREGGIDETWFDPFVGVRLTAPSTGKWLLAARGDVGGFGIGSDFAWQVRGTVGYRVSRLISVAAAYWAVGMDYENDTSTPTFKYDVTTFGPEFGVMFHF
jgi:hypothetical protein